ncbi:MAG: hypothetical protein HFJ38_05220 [Bacilli bacterium]|nr:hypothetical protein [Bacilli bacterium]
MKKGSEGEVKETESIFFKIHKEGLFSNILLVVILIFLIYVLFLTGVIKVSPKKTEVVNPDLEVDEKIEDKESLKVTDTLVTSLYKLVELGRSYNALRHYYFYSYDKLFVKYMDEAFIKEMALSRLTLADDSISFDANILENQYRNIVGNNTTYKNRTFQTQCSTVKYNASTHNYTISSNSGCSASTTLSEGYFDKILSAYKYSDRIEIITSVGYYEEEKELVGDSVYQSTGKIKVKRDMDTNDVIGTFTENLDQIKKIIDYDKLVKYKYTYRLDNIKYYFYSVEVVE